MRERQQMEKMIKMKRNGGDEKKMRVGDWQVEMEERRFWREIYILCDISKIISFKFVNFKNNSIKTYHMINIWQKITIFRIFCTYVEFYYN